MRKRHCEKPVKGDAAIHKLNRIHTPYGLPRSLRSLAMTVVLFFVMIIPAFAQSPAPTNDQAFTVLRAFYANRNYKPVWTRGERFNDRARNLPAIMADATRHGLDPETYGMTRMTTVLTSEKPNGPNAWKQAELFWTYNVWEYASDLAGMPLDAATLDSVLDGDIEDNLANLAPDAPLYTMLQDKLVQLDQAIASGTDPNPVKFNFGRPLFKPGMSNRQVPDLRARMVAFGAYEDISSDAAPGAEQVYDAQLAQAVSRFQSEYGLKNDGSIGPVTLQILNRSPQEERRQIAANLQRLREPHRRLREDNRIEVSIARYWLTGYENGREAIAMPVIVGKPGRQTISFRTEITGVRLNPTWNVPATIKKEDFIPQLLDDPTKLKYRVKVVHAGQTVDPELVDWKTLTPRELSQVRFWQPAGDGNALGRYRVIMSNPYDIYLHDTNHPELFKISMRAQSSGCVRVARPDELTDFILKNASGWNPQKIKETVAKGQTRDVVIENKIPIYLDYMTAWFNDRRQLILGMDVYALDKPRYDVLVKNGLTTQRNAQGILSRVTDILEPELKEAHRLDALTPTAN